MHPGFEDVWALLPRKVSKLAAQRAWDRQKPPVEQVKAALAWQVPIWERMIRGGDGQFVPHFRTYLSHGRWLDEPPWAQEPVWAPCGRCSGGFRVNEATGLRMKCECVK